MVSLTSSYLLNYQHKRRSIFLDTSEKDTTLKVRYFCNVILTQSVQYGFRFDGLIVGHSLNEIRWVKPYFPILHSKSLLFMSNKIRCNRKWKRNYVWTRKYNKDYARFGYCTCNLSSPYAGPPSMRFERWLV